MAKQRPCVRAVGEAMLGVAFPNLPFRSPENVAARHEEMERLAAEGKPHWRIAEAVGLTHHSTVSWHLTDKCRCNGVKP